uniref:Monocarboxylate transporter 10-like n=1 Tax=Saccoglossus kowalevskii TaxID=10224 RepID=A0ABM0MF62_SACKO|nr:PREDICTED: monocarboxylate transporter 10-like [Saccoglossus kowalevskii]
MAMCGIMSVISIYIESLTGQLISIFVIGVGVGGYVVLISFVVCCFMGIDKIGPGSSITYQVHGIFGLIAAPISGLMRDTYGSYEEVFWLAGVAYAIGAAAAFLLPLAKSRDVKRRKDGRAFDNSMLITEDYLDRLLVTEYLTTL